MQILFEEWLPHLSKEMYPRVQLEMPAEFVSYMQSDSLFVGGPHHESQIKDDPDEEATQYEEGFQGGSTDGAEEAGLFPESSFMPFHLAIKEAIASLGGSVLAKVGPSAGKDAIWITVEHSLKCTTPHDIYELLKASDRASLAIRCEQKKILSLIAWDQSLDPSMEFRLFVANKKLVSISQRDDTVHYPHLLSSRAVIRERIVRYFEAKVARLIPSLQHCTRLPTACCCGGHTRPP